MQTKNILKKNLSSLLSRSKFGKSNTVHYLGKTVHYIQYNSVTVREGQTSDKIYRDPRP